MRIRCYTEPDDSLEIVDRGGVLGFSVRTRENDFVGAARVHLSPHAVMVLAARLNAWAVGKDHGTETQEWEGEL